MAEISLTPKERQALKARAHALKPVVLVGAAGLSPAVEREIDRALAAHELIKVRVPGNDRREREATFASLADALSAARVQAIGKLLVLFRPAPPAGSPSQGMGDTMSGNNRSSRPARAKPTKSVQNTPTRSEVEKVRRQPAPRRDPGKAHRAAGRRNAPKRSPS